ncbi:hypothetical protein JCM3766R1_002057 [Sporobolomyces carnicolor]
MDPFEIRMQFLTLISRLTSSLASLSKVSVFALKHAQKCSDDIWDCYLDELTHSPSLNHRINMMYLLDLMLDKEGPKMVNKSSVGGIVGQGSYRALVERDLDKVVDQVVPRESKQGVLNHMSAMQVLKSWKTRRLLDGETLDKVTSSLEDRRNESHSYADESASSTTFTDFSRNDIVRRIEDDRERHKRLRERIWVLPIPSTIYQQPLLATPSPHHSATNSTNPKPSPNSPASPFEPALASTTATATSSGRNPLLPEKEVNGPSAGAPGGTGPELALEIEFDQLWDAMQEEKTLAIGPDEEDETTALSEANRSPTAGEGARKRRRTWALSPEEKKEMRTETERCFRY